MISEDEYILIMKLKDIDGYNEIKKENNKNINRNYNDIIEEEKKNNNFVDVVSPSNNLVEELNNFSEKLMSFGKFKNKSFQALYFENYNYCLWLSETIQDPKYDFLDFIQLVKKYKSPIYTPKNHH